MKRLPGRPASHGDGRELTLEACGCAFTVRCRDDRSAGLVTAGFSGLMPARASFGVAPLLCTTRAARTNRFVLAAPDERAPSVVDAPGLLYGIDKRLTLGLQHRRPALYFLHAAAVALGGRAAILAAPPGTGKSALTLALLDRGFEYLSDELAPVDVDRLHVWPYSHALCLKSPPPDRRDFPPETLDLGTRFHVPIEALPRPPRSGSPVPLAAICFIERDPPAGAGCDRMTTAAGAAHLAANALNALAHARSGISVAVALAARVPCYALNSADLGAACTAVRTILSGGCRSGGST